MMKQRLDATFKRANVVGPDLKLQADFARYLCVLVSGYIERAVVAFVLESESQAPVESGHEKVAVPSLYWLLLVCTQYAQKIPAQNLDDLLLRVSAFQ